MGEKIKDALETVAATTLVLADAAAAPAAAIPGIIGLAWMRLQERRVQRWWKVVVARATDPDALSAKIEAGACGR